MDEGDPVDCTLTFTVKYNKQCFELACSPQHTVRHVKSVLEQRTGVPSSNQKLMFKGATQDAQTLQVLGVQSGDKMIMVGSKPDDIRSVSGDAKDAAAPNAAAAADGDTRLPFSKQPVHQKVLEKYGRPDDLMPGIRSVHDPLPPTPLYGMYNKCGHKVRLTFKLEDDEFWIGTKDRTEKIKMTSVQSIVSQPIHDQEHYHIMGIQLGPTDKSRYWIYWVPAQYVQAIRRSVLG